MENKASFDTQMIEASKQVVGFALFLTQDQDKANDLMQEALLKAYKYKHHFEVGTNAKAWLSRIIRTTFIDTINKKGGKSKDAVFYQDTILDVHLYKSPVLNQANTTLQLEEIYECMQEVNQEWIKPFLLSYEGYKYREIAETLNIPLGTVKGRIHKAKEELKYKLKRRGYKHY